MGQEPLWKILNLILGHDAFSIMSDTAQEYIAFGRTYRSYMTPYCYKD